MLRYLYHIFLYSILATNILAQDVQSSSVQGAFGAVTIDGKIWNQNKMTEVHYKSHGKTYTTTEIEKDPDVNYAMKNEAGRNMTTQDVNLLR